MENGRFRPDLYNRLAAFPIMLPPLRERGSDLALLGRRFRIRAARDANRPVPTLHPDALDLLRNHSWPGNVRELRNVLTRAVLKCRGSEILPEHLDLLSEPDRVADQAASFSPLVQHAWASGQPELHEFLQQELDRVLIQHALSECAGNRTEIARRLGLTTNTVLKLIRKFGLDRSDGNQPE